MGEGPDTAFATYLLSPIEGAIGTTRYAWKRLVEWAFSLCDHITHVIKHIVCVMEGATPSQ